MIGPGELARALQGAWRVFIGAPDAMRHFDTSIDGFWRSFLVIVPVAPLFALSAFAEYQSLQAMLPADVTVDGTAFFWKEAVRLCLDWVALPLLLAALAGILGIRQTYAAFITVRNWVTIAIVLPFVAISLLGAAGLLSENVQGVLAIVALGFALRMMYMAARIALKARWDLAAGIVVLDFLTSLLTLAITDRLFGIPLA